LAKVFSTDWTLNMRLLSEVRRDYDNVFPPIRDRLYRLMVADGLFPSSPARMRQDWMIPGALLLVAAFVLPRYWPSRFDVYGITERWIFNFDGVKVDAPGWYTGSAPFSLDSYHSGLTLFGRNTTEAILTSRTGGFASGTSGFTSGSSGSGGRAGGGSGGGGGGTF